MMTFAAMACAVTLTTQPGILLTYDMSNNYNLQQNVAGHANVSGSDLTYAGRAGYEFGEWSGNANGQVWAQPEWPGTNPDESREYFTVTGTVTGLDVGESLNVDAINLDWRVFSGDGKRNYNVLVFGSASRLSSGDVLHEEYEWEGPKVWKKVAVDLVDHASYKSLANGDTFEFRIYVNGPNKRIAFDNIEVTGTVVKESSNTLGLLIAFCGGLFFIRKLTA